LPLLVALYKSEADNRKAGKRPKTPQHLVRPLCWVLRRWQRQRRFVLAGDGDDTSHETADFASRRRGRRSLVRKFSPDARL
jgi:hypothetical protein